MKHSKQFWKSKHQQLRNWAREFDKTHGTNEATTKFKQFMRTRTDFREFWETAQEMGEKDITKFLRYNLIYDQSYMTALAEYKTIKDLETERFVRDYTLEFGNDPSNYELNKHLKDIRFRDFKKMSHQEFIDTYHTDLEDYYANLKQDFLNEGFSKRDAVKRAKNEIGMNWFGSPTR